MGEFGALLSHMLRTLRLKHGVSMREVTEAVRTQLDISVSTLNKWREETLHPSTHAIEALLAIGITDAGMDRQWAESFLRTSNHPHPQMLLDIYSPAPHVAYHNLPRRSYAEFFDRDAEKERIFDALSRAKPQGVVHIYGLEGFGKSALALDIAWNYVEHPQQFPAEDRFDYVVWFSAKRTRLTPNGITEPFIFTSSAREMYDTLAAIVGEILLEEDDEKLNQRRVYERLQKLSRVLLIIDNLDDIVDQNEAAKITALLDALPASTKALVTTTMPGHWATTINLGPLSRRVMEDIVRKECAARDIKNLSDEQQKRIAKEAGSFPLAAWWAISKIAMGTNVAQVLRDLHNDHSDVLSFIFRDYFKSLYTQHKQAFHVLIALTHFSRAGATPAFLACLTGYNEAQCLNELHFLQTLHLVSEVHPKRYAPLSLTNSYMTVFKATPPKGSEAWLDQGHQWFSEARIQWLAIYETFIREHMHFTGESWYEPYRELDEEIENILHFLDLHANHHQEYSKLKELLLSGDDDLLRYLDVTGHWNERKRFLKILLANGDLSPEQQVRALNGIAMTLVLRAQPAEGQELLATLAKADAICLQLPDAIGDEMRCRLRQVEAFHESRLGKFENARHLLAVAWAHSIERLTPGSRQRLHREAEHHYRLGTIYYHEGDLEEARKQFTFIIEHFGTKRLRTRLASYCWLAEIALRRDNLNEARQQLDNGWPLAQMVNEKRRIAAYHRAFARLRVNEGRYEEARRDAQLAHGLFERLGMVNETEQMHLFLHDLEETAPHTQR